MKLFIVAALIAVAAAARLEHLERSYLPPDQSGPSQGSFGSNGGFNSFGSNGGSQGSRPNGNLGGSHSSNGFGLNRGSSFGQSSNGFGAQGHSSNGFSGTSNGLGNGGFEAATSNQYLPPDQGPSAAASNGFRTFGSASRPSSSFGSFASQGSQYNGQSQFGAASRQYLAPKSSSFQNVPQQAFDEETGYHY